MLTRLLVLAAVIAAFFVFVPTSSAQTTTPTLPTECLNIATPGAVTQDCLDALAGLAGGGEDGTLPESCEAIIGGGTGGGTGGAEGPAGPEMGTGGGVGAQQVPVLDPILDELSAADLLRIVECLNDLAGLEDDEEEEEEEVDDNGGGTGDNGGLGEGDLGQVGDEGLGDGGGGGDEGDFPEGGIESGYGPTGSDEAGAPLAARGVALLALLGVLATGLVVMRRRSGS